MRQLLIVILSFIVVLVGTLIALSVGGEDIMYTTIIKKQMATNSSVSKQTYEVAKLKVATQTLNVEIADTPDKRRLGLSFRDKLEENTGMLFIMDSAARHSFWMYQMRFPLDFIWIKDGKIVDITENVLPPTQSNNQIATAQPKEDADQVLEVNIGYAANRNIHIGDTVTVVK